jgi:hypothetical protein
MPDSIFPNQKSQFGQTLECLAMKDVGINILWPFGTFRGNFGTFFSFWYVIPRKIWQP